MAYDFTSRPNSLEEFWLPFTPQRLFKEKPRILVSADGMYYKDQDGNDILDACAGLWCVNAGHNVPRIKEAIKDQLDLLDFTSNFQVSSGTAFKAASRLVSAFPDHISHVFFCNSGSEAVDTAIKIALAYWRVKGEPQKQLIVGRERAYHGVGFGGISVGGIAFNRKMFSGAMLPHVDHLPHTHNLEKNAFSRGEPEWGAHLADDLERIILLHDPSNVAAVIVEPVSGSTGVLPPPKGYLKRLEAIARKYGVLLIFDEVVTAFGRFGTTTAAEHFGVSPDLICCAKGITNGTIPMGAVFCREGMYEAFMNGAKEFIEFAHGYTYSGHPLASAAAIATLDTYQQEKLFENAKAMMGPWEDALHSLKGTPHVVDIRNCGILGGIELETFTPEDPYRHARETFSRCFEKGVMMRYSGPNLALSPPLILDHNHIDQIVTTIGEVLRGL